MLNELLPSFRIKVLLQVFIGHDALEAIARHFGMSSPQERVQNNFAEVLAAPVLVEMRAGEPEAAPAVWPLDRPREHLFASAGGHDVWIRSTRRGRFALPGLVVRLADQNRRDAFHFRAKTDIVIPFVADLKRFHAARDRMIRQALEI